MTKKVYDQRNIANIPQHVLELIRKVKIFSKELEPEPPADLTSVIGT